MLLAQSEKSQGSGDSVPGKEQEKSTTGKPVTVTIYRVALRVLVRREQSLLPLTYWLYSITSCPYAGRTLVQWPQGTHVVPDDGDPSLPC